jgi:hypothetical protein
VPPGRPDGEGGEMARRCREGRDRKKEIFVCSAKKEKISLFVLLFIRLIRKSCYVSYVCTAA